MNYDLGSYETVKERKKRFYTAYPDGRIIVHVENDDVEEKAVVRAAVYLNREDQEKDLPRSVGYALELRDKELSKSKKGTMFESVNFSSWLENCEESAVGRALDNAGFGSDKASKDEMQKAQRLTEQYRGQPSTSHQQAPLASTKHAPVASSNAIMPFGKTKGTPLANLAPGELESALLWARSKNKFTEFQQDAEAELNRRMSGEPKKETQEIPEYITEDLPF